MSDSQGERSTTSVNGIPVSSSRRRLLRSLSPCRRTLPFLQRLSLNADRVAAAQPLLGPDSSNAVKRVVGLLEGIELRSCGRHCRRCTSF